MCPTGLCRRTMPSAAAPHGHVGQRLARLRRSKPDRPARLSHARHAANGDVLPTLLVDGHVAGVWRATDEGIEATAFHRLAEGDWTGLDNEARALLRFLAERDPMPYRRFAHWWAKLPRAEIRVLGR